MKIRHIPGVLSMGLLSSSMAAEQEIPKESEHAPPIFECLLENLEKGVEVPGKEITDGYECFISVGQDKVELELKSGNLSCAGGTYQAEASIGKSTGIQSDYSSDLKEEGASMVSPIVIVPHEPISVHVTSGVVEEKKLLFIMSPMTKNVYSEGLRESTIRMSGGEYMQVLPSEEYNDSIVVTTVSCMPETGELCVINNIAQRADERGAVISQEIAVLSLPIAISDESEQDYGIAMTNLEPDSFLIAPSTEVELGMEQPDEYYATPSIRYAYMARRMAPVPETTSASFGCLGMSFLLIRRKKGDCDCNTLCNFCRQKTERDKTYAKRCYLFAMC